MIICGIDVGKTGAIALLDTTATIYDTPMLWDIETLNDGTIDAFWFYTLLDQWGADVAVIEGVFRPNSLVKLAGEVSAICKLKEIPLTIVPVVTWKKEILGENTSDKKRSIELCQQIYPTANLNRPSPKIQKPVPNADRAEALLLAEYLRRVKNNLIQKNGKKSKNI
jgi:hypothetical protein